MDCETTRKGTLQGKRILVVGGATGIGLVLVRTLVKLGCQVIIASRAPEKRYETLPLSAGEVRTEAVDLTNEDSIRQLSGRIGQLDHLVVTARTTQPPQSLAEGETPTLRRAFDVKFWGQYLLARHITPRLSHDGSITFTSGTAAIRYYPGYSIVAAMNAATESLAKNLAVELAPLRVNVVSPGFVDTDPPSASRYENSLRLAGRIPAGRLATPQEIADAYIFLMTNTYASGSVVVVDGASNC
jgi:NAD(P)-dependent dehydrogenase (short-subunit alcohol dehydrogenase family)